MKNKVFCTLLIILLLPSVIFGQINISELVQASKTAKQSDNSLYLIDFWATWCAPCIHVKKYLGSLQQQFPEDFYIISISQENPDKVKSFLEKKPTNLAVAIDYKGEAFKKYNIRSLPQAILINADGIKLWEGHPADFKSSDVARFLRQQKKQSSFKNLFKIKQDKKEIVESKKVYKPKSNFDFREINEDMSSAFEVFEKADYLELKGSLRDILSYVFNVYKDQVRFDDIDLDKSYYMYLKKDALKFEDYSSTILEALSLNFVKSYNSGSTLVFDIEKSKFWNTNQINWGNDSRRYLISDTDIQADNITFNDLKFRLSNLLGKPIVVNGDFDAAKKHDWNLHYKYYDLMKNDLYDNYGIEVRKEKNKFPVYTIIKKAP